MKRIMIIGCGGAGKSTLAKALHRLTNLPLIHLDQLYFEPNWVEIKKSKWTSLVTNIAQQDEWIMDGNYGGTMDIRLEKADTIIFLDRPTWLLLFRVFKRFWQHYGQTRSDMAEGCTERLEWVFIHYIARYNLTRRPAILKKLAYWKSKKNVLILRSDQAVKDYLKTVKG